jgi:hypothetical protein
MLDGNGLKWRNKGRPLRRTAEEPARKEEPKLFLV